MVRSMRDASSRTSASEAKSVLAWARSVGGVQFFWVPAVFFNGSASRHASNRSPAVVVSVSALAWSCRICR
jgi:hypothetical protein